MPEPPELPTSKPEEKPHPAESAEKESRNKELASLGRAALFESFPVIKHLYKLCRFFKSGGVQMKKEGWVLFSITIIFVVGLAIFSTCEVMEHFKETPTQAQTQKILNPAKSPSMQVGAATNATQNNNYSQNTFQGAGQNQNSTFYAPQNNYYYGVVSNSVTRDAFDALEAKLDNASTNIDLTRNDVRLLAQSLRDLDQRTSDIEKLPDGRTRFGTLVTGTPKVVMEAYEAGYASLTNGDFQAALLHFQKARDAAESETNVTGSLMSGAVQPAGIAEIYFEMALVAQRMGSNSIANEYALVAANKNPSPENKGLLSTTLHQLAIESFRKNDFTNAFVFGDEAISNYESAESSLTNSQISQQAILGMYLITAQSANMIGEINKAQIYTDKAKFLKSIQFHY